MAFVLTRDIVNQGYGMAHGYTGGGAIDTVAKAEKVLAKDEKKKADEKRMAAHLMNGGLTVGTTLAFGVLEGYRQKVSTDGKCTITSGIPGFGMVSADLITGVGLHLVSLLGYVKNEQQDQMVQSIANGALSFWAASFGTTLGDKLRKSREEAAKKAGTKVEGYLHEGSREQLNADDVYSSQFGGR